MTPSPRREHRTFLGLSSHQWGSALGGGQGRPPSAPQATTSLARRERGSRGRERTHRNAWSFPSPWSVRRAYPCRITDTDSFWGVVRDTALGSWLVITRACQTTPPNGYGSPPTPSPGLDQYPAPASPSCVIG